MNDAQTLARTGFEFRTRGELPLSQSEAWDRLTTQWFPNWLGLQSIPLMVGGPLVKNPGKNREVIGRVLGSALGHRVRVEYTSPLVSATIIVQATLMEVGSSTILELDVENAPNAAALETLREVWTQRVELVVREVREEMERRRGVLR